MSRNIMADLETMGTRAGSVILSIGAVVFDPDKNTVSETFYEVINYATCVEAGLTEDAATVKWWSEQSADAQQVLTQARCENKKTHSLRAVLQDFRDFVDDDALVPSFVWGNGAGFDNTLLECAYDAVARPRAWRHYNNRCYRTLKNLRPDIGFTRIGTHHNALDDAITQAVHACALLRAMKA